MVRLIIGLAFFLLACGGADKNGDDSEEQEGGQFGALQSAFRSITVPYQLTDTGLLKNRDTTTIRASLITPLIPDSVSKALFGKVRPKFFPMVRWEGKSGEQYYLVQARWTSKRAALLMVIDADKATNAYYPFLISDANASTSQATSVDKNFTITKNVTEKAGSDVVGEGKEVVAYDATEKAFSLIMTDLLKESTEVINPIDTVSATNKLAGDYTVNKRNLLSIRDGRAANQLLMYLHTETADGDCKGEIRGNLLITSGTTAVYRQGGDPCVLQITFRGNKATVAEQTGCGNYRGLDCPLAGTFTRKKPSQPKTAVATTRR